MIHTPWTHPWEYAIDPFRIGNDLFYVGNRYVSSYLINTGHGLILIDSGLPQTLYLLLESIRRLGFHPEDIAYVLHTHGHYDHIGGTRALVGISRARTAIGTADAEMIAERPELTRTHELGLEFFEGFEVDLALTDGQTIKLGHTTVTCVHTPGHTAGCFSFFFDTIERGRILRAGLPGGRGLSSLSGDYLSHYGLPVTCRESYLASIRKLRSRQVDITLGEHPDQNGTFHKLAGMTEECNPFVDKGEWLVTLASLEEGAMEAFTREAA